LDLIVDRVPVLPVLLIVTFRHEFTPPWTGRPAVRDPVWWRLRCPRLSVSPASGLGVACRCAGQFVAQLLEQSLHAMRLDGLERDPIYSRGPIVALLWVATKDFRPLRPGFPGIALVPFS
jgi:hypothetical protein